MRDLANLFWPPSPAPGPRGRFSALEGTIVLGRANIAFWAIGVIARYALPDPFASKWSWGLGSLAALAVMAWGYVHYRNLDPPPVVVAAPPEPPAGADESSNLSGLD